MDPVSIVGVAAAAIQFCTFTTSVATATWRATLSSSKLTAEASDFEVVALRFRKIVEGLDKQLQIIKAQADDTHLSEMEFQLQQICADCLPKARKLHAAASELAASMNKSGKMQKLWKALQSEFKQGNIQSLTGTLTKLQDDICHSMIVCAWHSARDTQNAIASLSKQMTAIQDAVLLPRNDGSSPSGASAFVLDVTNHELVRSKTILKNVDWSGDHIDLVWDELKRDFEGSHWPRKPMDTGESSSQRHLQLARDVISTLRFDTMDARHDAISAPHASTFEWIWHTESAIPEASLQPKWSSFPAWLEGPSKTPYWVTGRPGSGKSTLMRFIKGHGNLQHHLSRWRPDLRLQVLSYFAWNPSSDPQKSVEGLLRTILFQILDCEPHLLPSVLPRRWAFSTATWSTLYPQEFEAQDMEQLEEGLMSLLSTAKPTMKLMVFVDGLDEFDVAPKHVVQTVESISRHDNVKLCIASRPWNAFEDSFESGPHLKIHDLTENDIKTFIYDKFATSIPGRRRSSETEHLRTEIQEHASGVFQWVVVVVSFVLNRLEDGDPLHEILKILKELPKELSDLSTAIWARLVPEKQEQAREIFMLRLVAPHHGPLNYLTLWCVAERHFDVSSIELLKDTAKDPQTLRSIVLRFLNSRTLGLVELDVWGTVVFLHRTIPEWLEATGILGASTLQAHTSTLKGLCVLGGHIAPLYPEWGSLILYLVGFHLNCIVSGHTLSDTLTQDIASWLQELEKTDVSLYLNGLYESGILDHPNHEFEIVDLAALTGFNPYVESYLKLNTLNPQSHLFTSCVDIVDYKFHPTRSSMPLRMSFKRRWDLVRLCLEHGVTPFEYDEESGEMKDCSLRKMAQKFRQFARNPDLFHNGEFDRREVFDYCIQVAFMIESSPNYKRQVLSRFREKASSSMMDFKKKLGRQ